MFAMSKNDLPNLDFLRSFAVLLVAVAHFITYYTGGTARGWMGLTGVCMFFIHTCLVLMWSLERDPHTGRFYVRRWFRLFPLWLVVLAFIVIFKVPTSPAAGPHFGYVAPSLPELLANATMTFNFHFGARVVGASWTLPIEADMYVLLPMLFFFVRSTRSLWPLLLIDSLVILCIYGTYGIHRNPIVTFPVCIPYFLPGVMAYALYKKQVTPIVPAWAFPVFLAIMAAIHYRYGNYTISSYWCLVIGLTLPYFRELTWRPMTITAHQIARYSYGIYLCHLPCIWLGMHFFNRYGLVPEIGVAILAVSISSVTLYHLVEAPMIRFGGRLAKKLDPGPGTRMDETTLSLEPAP